MRRHDRHIAGRQNHLAGALRAVGQQQSAGVSNDVGNGGQVLAVARLRIDMLHSDQWAFALHRFEQHVEIKHTIAANRQPFRLRRGLEQAIVLHCRYQARTCLCMAKRHDRSLARAAGENYFATPIQPSFHPLTSVLEEAARLAPLGMGTGRIGPQREAFIHRRTRFGAQRRGGGMVEIDAFQDDTCSK